MKIGQLVKAYAKKVFRYCDEGDHDELARLMDAKYSKDTFGIHFPFCAEVETISPQQSMRYWRDIHVVRGKTDSKNYVPLGNNEQVRMILDLGYAEVSALVDRYIVIINSLFPDDAITHHRSASDDGIV